MTTEIKNDNILRGYTSQATAYKVDDYPYGFRLRTSIHYWIETRKGHGDRFCSYTINPKTGRANKPKCGTYGVFKYMFINEQGHVEDGGIDSYNREVFEARFYFIIERIGEQFLSENQKNNIRINHYQHVKLTYPYHIVKYSEEKKQFYTKWMQDTLKHIKTCEFKELVNYPEAPEEDNPEGEVKMTVTVKEEKQPEAITHEITAERVTEILNKVLPGFYINVREYKQTFGGNFLQIAAAASGHNINGVASQKVQLVSLSLDLKTLELQPQVYGGSGGQSIYREPNQEDAKERFLAMKSVKIPFRRPPCNEKDVLSAIERFAINYKNTLIENIKVLKYQDIVNYSELLNKTA